MKIAYIIPSKANKGPIIVVNELVKQMVNHNHKCVVYYFDDINELSFLCETKKISFYKSIDFNAFDIIHSHGLRPDLYVFIHKPIKCKSKTITTIHNYVFEDFKYQYNKFIAYTFGNVWISLLCRHDKIVTLSIDAMKYYKNMIKGKELCYAYNTIGVINTNDKISNEDERLICQFRGNDIIIGVNAVLTGRKGVDQLIKVLPKLQGYRLIIVGNGKVLLDLKKMAESFSVIDRVLFLGYRRAAYRFLPYYDIFAIPSRSEGFGLTILEAAVYRKKLLCSDIPIFRELLTENEAVYFKVDDLDSLVKAIKKITSLDKLGDNLNKKYNEEYSPECFYNKYISIYNNK